MRGEAEHQLSGGGKRGQTMMVAATQHAKQFAPVQQKSADEVKGRHAEQ
jgi:hypothetical protein